ncbi:MAG: nitrite reductase, copper-containing [Elusimicrobia bacterium]|nr:nitrite reductase, copper-containing [Elusimicrobiota bacterium]
MIWKTAVAITAAAVLLSPPARAAEPVIDAVLTTAPNVPPPIRRRGPAVVRVTLTTQEKLGTLDEGLGDPTQYDFWTFNGTVPGPFIRLRVGDTLQMTIKNPAGSAMSHGIDMHAVAGPGGGEAVLLAKPGESKTGRFKMLTPGLFIYHCAAPPVSDHIANGMYGLLLVEPKGGLPKADEEFYVMQSEFYTKEPFDTEGVVHYDPEKAAAETPTYIVFNGRLRSLMDDDALKAKVGDKVRIFFGDIGPNKISSFHVIGSEFENVYREGGFRNPEHDIQTTLVPAGGATTVELTPHVPGTYILVDHAIFRMAKGAVGQLKVSGAPRPDIYEAVK